MLLLLRVAARSAGRPARSVPEHGASACAVPAPRPLCTTCSWFCPVPVARSPSSPGHLSCSRGSGTVPRSFWILWGVWGCWSKRHVPLVCGSSPTLSCTDPAPCCVRPGLYFGVPLFCQRSVLWLGGSLGKSHPWTFREWFGLRHARWGRVGAGPAAPVPGALPGSVGCWDTPKPWAGLLPCGVGCRQRLLQPLAPARPHLGELGAAPTPATASGSVAAPAALGASLGASPGLCWPRKFQLPVTASGFFFYPPGQISASPHAVPFQPAAAASSPPRQRGQLGVSSAGPWWPRCVFQRRRRCPPAHVTAAGAAGLAPAGLRSWSCVQRGGTGPSPGLPFPRQCSTWLRTAALPLAPSRVEEPSSLQRSSPRIS